MSYPSDTQEDTVLGILLIMFFVLMFALIIALIFYTRSVSAYAQEEIKIYEDEIATYKEALNKSYKLCGPLDAKTINTFGGIYFPNSHYCVWTKNRTQEQISTSENHEICHALISKDYKHFCQDGWTQ